MYAYLTARPGDVFFTRSTTLLGRAIRWAERGPQEAPSWTNHTGLFVSPGIVAPLEPGAAVPHADEATAVEALWHVEQHRWLTAHRKEHGNRIRVYRPLFLDELGTRVVVHAAQAHVGQKYGAWKLAFHLADRVLFDGRHVMSRLLFLDSRPICSYLVARSFEVAGYPEAFGFVPAVAADPDTMMDWVEGLRSAAWTFIGEARVD